jgi:hypothetical protein
MGKKGKKEKGKNKKHRDNLLYKSTCFWNGIIESLQKKDRKALEFKKQPNIMPLIERFKRLNCKTENVYWKGTDGGEDDDSDGELNKLTDKQMEENYDHIRDFQVGSIKNGYGCSTCEPFLCLLCQLVQVDILHNYNGHQVKYNFVTEEGSEWKNGKRKKPYKFASNTYHFWKS